MNHISIAIQRSVAAAIDFVIMLAVILIVIKVLGQDPELILASAWQSNIIGFGSLFFIEAILVAAIGKTPGMALLGLSVRNQDGTNLSLGKALLRSLFIFVLGIGAGIPLYGLIYIVLGVSLIKLLLAGSAFWDDILHTTVVKKQQSVTPVSVQ